MAGTTPTIKVLSPGAIDKLGETYDRTGRSPRSRREPTPFDYNDVSPDVYIAKIPDAGIAARESLTKVHFAECQIYNLVQDSSTGDYKLEEVSGFKIEKVFNMYPVKWFGTSGRDILCQIHRSKYGFWLAEKPPFRQDAVVTESSGISANSSGDVTIKINGSDSDVVTAWLDWMHGGQKISNGKQCVIEFMEDKDRWGIREAECETT